ncbi:MAG: hypothetical protein EB117_11350 [Betaproteobacteria bacterium]|nr:hypothetical protein [Betaproteobacteria bacterium]
MPCPIAQLDDDATVKADDDAVIDPVVDVVTPLAAYVALLTLIQSGVMAVMMVRLLAESSTTPKLSSKGDCR